MKINYIYYVTSFKEYQNFSLNPAPKGHSMSGGVTFTRAGVWVIFFRDEWK